MGAVTPDDSVPLTEQLNMKERMIASLFMIIYGCKVRAGRAGVGEGI